MHKSRQDCTTVSNDDDEVSGQVRGDDAGRTVELSEMFCSVEFKDDDDECTTPDDVTSSASTSSSLSRTSSDDNQLGISCKTITYDELGRPRPIASRRLYVLSCAASSCHLLWRV